VLVLHGFASMLFCVEMQIFDCKVVLEKTAAVYSPGI
jgi:hypothetical protein